MGKPEKLVESGLPDSPGKHVVGILSFLARLQQSIMWGMLFITGAFIAIATLFGLLYYWFVSKAPKQSPNLEYVTAIFLVLLIFSAALAFYAHKKFKEA